MSQPRDGRSRRGLLQGAGAIVAATPLAGCGGSSSAATSGQSTAPPVPPKSPRDVQLLATALELERRTVDAYVACVPLLGATEAKAAKLWLSEEIQHTGELIALIRQAGGKAPPRAGSYAIGRLPRNRAQTLALLAGFEARQVAYYVSIISQLQLASARAAIGTILSSDAQHIALLRLVQGQPAVPSAFVA